MLWRLAALAALAVLAVLTVLAVLAAAGGLCVVGRLVLRPVRSCRAASVLGGGRSGARSEAWRPRSTLPSRGVPRGGGGGRAAMCARWRRGVPSRRGVLRRLGLGLGSVVRVRVRVRIRVRVRVGVMVRVQPEKVHRELPLQVLHSARSARVGRAGARGAPAGGAAGGVLYGRGQVVRARLQPQDIEQDVGDLVSVRAKVKGNVRVRVRVRSRRWRPARRAARWAGEPSARRAP